MSFLHSVRSIYKRHTLIRIVSQLSVLVLIYFSIRAWQSMDDIQGRAPNINASMLKGEVFDLSEHQSKPVLIHFWATWCPVCQFENSNIANLVKDYQVITLVSWSGDEAQIREYLKKENLNLPVIVDNEGEWAKIYAVQAVPSSFFIDAKGMIQFIEKGYTSEIGLRLRLWWLQ